MDLLDRLLGHDAWTTRRLLELSMPLADDLLDQTFDIGHKTVRKTLDHVIWNVECWTDLMMGDGVRARPASNQSISSLIQRFDGASKALASFARTIVDQHRLDDTFLDSLANPPQRLTFGGTILHIATHGMHHRAQLLFMLRRLGVQELPEGDVLSWEHQFQQTSET